MSDDGRSHNGGVAIAPPAGLYGIGGAKGSIGKGRGKGGYGKGGYGKGGYGKGGHGKGGDGKSQTPSPALLTSFIKKACTLEALFETSSAHESLMNHIHLSACWNSLGHLTREADANWFEQHAAALESLVLHTTRTVSTGQGIGARELANIAHGVAKCGRGSTMSALMSVLGGAIMGRLGECKEQELANVAWAFAKAGQTDDALFTALARVAERCLLNFKAQELANTAWAFATAGHSDAQLFSALGRAVEQRLEEFNTQGLANTAMAFAKAGHVDAQLFKAMAKTAQRRVNDFNAQDLAHTAWSFAKLGQFDAALFMALARSTERHLNHFNAQGLANTVWAFAKAGHLDEGLFAALAKSVERRLDEFNSQDLANTAWAFAKACHSDARLFAALARSAERCLEDFNVQDLVNTAWAFAKLGQFDGQLFAAVAQSLATRRLDDLTAPHIANIAWAFAKASQLEPKLFAALATSATQRVGDFSAQDLATIAWTFANAKQLDAALFTALARSAEHLLDEFNDEELDNTEWAFVQAGQQKIAKSLRQRRKRTSTVAPRSGPSVDVSKCGRIVVAGGGIGGAAVAVALQSKGFDVVVLEADSSLEARKQGYGLTIQRQDATQAMGVNLAQDDAPSTSHYTFSAEGQILGFFGEAFGSKSKGRQESQNSGRFIHIPRQVLRARIVDQIRPGTIQWGSKLNSFRSREEDGEGAGKKNGVSVTLTDGTTLDAALLVGSDGIFSTVRRQLKLSGDRLNYVGLIVVLGIVEESSLAVPLTQRRIFETVDGTTRIYAMPFTTSSTMWQLSFPYAEEPASMLAKDTAALKEEIVRRCADWHEPIPALLRSTPLECMSGYPVYDRELLEAHVLRTPLTTPAAAGAQPAPQRRVTLIGDAAHPMTPFKAQGANQALSDAVLLADTLVDSIRKHGPHAGVDAALPLFEQKMLSRSSRMVVGSREKAKELHSSLALQPARKVQRETGSDMHQAIRVLRAKGIGAHNATDARGLDAVVAEAVDMSRENEQSSARHVDATESVPAADKKRKAGADSAAGREGKRRKPLDDQCESRTDGRNDFGFDWRQTMLKRLTPAAEAGMRRRLLRKQVLRRYLRHLSEQQEADGERRWWEAHPVELKALFHKHLKRAKADGQLRLQGKIVRKR
jgi:2-polyprenyl-6-methoxyphenol hydroxylase-like FAD-dependent oxidoreductase